MEYSGSLLMARDERDAMENELALATALTIIVVQLSIYLSRSWMSANRSPMRFSFWASP